jgi:GH24 family phage-related lysozyme (muramidase)
LATTVLIQPWEGRRLVAYRDIVGVLTICDGDTQHVRPGMRETPAGCDERTQRRVEQDFYKPLTRCIATFTAGPISWQAAMTSTAYNVGVSAICNSTAARRGREKRWADSCHALTAFIRAGGKIVQGLKNRREYGDATRIGELELCLEGL